MQITGEELDVQLSNFRSQQESIYETTNLEEVYKRIRILESFETYLKRGSGFTDKVVLRLEVTLIHLNPLRGSSDLTLPKWIRDKKAITNIRNKDNFCFKWSITRGLNPVEVHGERVTKLLHEQAEELNWEGIEFPTSCSGRVFERFERGNGISLYVFGHNEDSIVPLYTSKTNHPKSV